jgi:hypothetical protein
VEKYNSLAAGERMVDVLYENLENDQKVVIAATSDKLIRMLVDGTETDASYILRFLLTYRYHLNAGDLLEALVNMYSLDFWLCSYTL